MSRRKEQHEMFGPTPKDPLDDPQFRADLSRIQGRLDQEAAEVRERAERAERYFMEVIEPRLAEQIDWLGLTAEEFAEETQDPYRFRMIFNYSVIKEISYAEAREGYDEGLLERMEPLDEAVELAYPVVNSYKGAWVLPVMKRRIVRRIWARKQWPKATKPELAQRPSWREAVARHADMKRRGEIYPFEEQLVKQGTSQQPTARELQPSPGQEPEPQIEEAHEPTQLDLWNDKR